MKGKIKGRGKRGVENTLKDIIYMLLKCFYVIAVDVAVLGAITYVL